MKIFGFHVLTHKQYLRIEQRLLDIESHFAIERDANGRMTKSLADVPVEERKNLRKASALRGGTWHQRRQYLEATDGGRKI